MSIAFFADIHANLEALEALLDATSGCRARYCGGDVVGYGDRPNEVCDLLRRLEIPCAMGNHDAFVAGRLRPDPVREPIYRTGWTQSVLSNANREWLESLPDELWVADTSEVIRVRHASPWDLESRLDEGSPAMMRAMPSDGSTLVVGHTHRSFVVAASGGRVVNCGSVGLPRAGSPGAHHAMFEPVSGAWRLCTVPYDIQALQRRLAARGWDDSVIRRLGHP